MFDHDTTTQKLGNGITVIPSQSRLQRSPESFRGEARLSIPWQNRRYLRGVLRLRFAPLRMTALQEQRAFKIAEKRLSINNRETR
jgi:hypothetical protein